MQDFPLHIGPLPGGSEKEYSFVVRSQLYEGCVAELHLDALGCPAAAVESDVRLLVLASSGFTNYVRVPDFISERSIFQLVDLSGRILYEMEFSADTRRALIELPVTVAGMYLVRIKSRDGQQHLSKIIIP